MMRWQERDPGVSIQGRRLLLMAGTVVVAILVLPQVSRILPLHSRSLAAPNSPHRHAHIE